jgi:hypothetical protein
MSTLLLSLLLIALVAIGLLMASTKVRESFVNAPSAAPSIVASPVMASLLATPNLSSSSGSPQVNTIGRDGDLQTATDAGSQTKQPVTSYSAVGPANGPINSMSDLTPFEANYLKKNRAKGNTPLDAPPDSNERATIAAARENGSKATQRILNSDYSVTENTMTLEEILAIMNARTSTSTQGPPTPTEIATASDMRRTWAAARKANPSGVTMPITGPAASVLGLQGPSPNRGPSSMESRMALNEEEMSALTSVRKEEAKRKARLLLLQDQENKRKAQEISGNRSNKRDEDYEDDYGVMDGRRRRERHERHEICPECEQCPDMSQYVKLDEIPCWNCSLP